MNVYWTDVDSACVGLDPRTGVSLGQFTNNEIALIEGLARPTSETEFVERGKKAKITKKRIAQLLAFLRREKLVYDGELRGSDQQAAWRTSGRTHSRSEGHVQIYRADHLGVEIALHLACAGVGTISILDQQPVGSTDHPLMQRGGFGVPRAQVLATELRAINPRIALTTSRKRTHIRSSGEILSTDRTKPLPVADNQPHPAKASRPDVLLLTGYHALDPFVSRAVLSQGVPVFHGCAEEYDLLVGPFALPNQGTCAQCLYLQRLDADPSWSRLGPQAVRAMPAPPHSAACGLGATLATRDILAFLDREEILLQHAAWNVPPTNAAPALIDLPPHPECGCCVA